MAPGSDQHVRDLLWAINSPPLVWPDDSGRWPRLNADVIDCDHLAAYVNERGEHRVGHYFESLIHYWLRHVRGLEIVAHRLPVRGEGKTLGELDFVFRDEAGCLIHWEVAVKFYLVTLETPPRHLGPNTSDSLDRKILRMLRHQLPLSRMVYDGIAARHAIVKGLIYQHAFAPDPSPPASDLNPCHLRGLWLHQRELPSFLSASAGHLPMCGIMRKPYWLAATPNRVPVSELVGMVNRHFNDAGTALHVVCMDEHGREVSRLFIVSDEWPDQND